ncbi:chromosome partition protein MukE, partial [Vibrio parahaemolyticus]
HTKEPSQGSLLSEEAQEEQAQEEMTEEGEA